MRISGPETAAPVEMFDEALQNQLAGLRLGGGYLAELASLLHAFVAGTATRDSVRAKVISARAEDLELGGFWGAFRSGRNVVVKVVGEEGAACGLIFLPKDGFIPMHDHPEMEVLSKVLSGVLYYRSLTAAGPALQEEVPDVEDLAAQRLGAQVFEDRYLEAGQLVEVQPVCGNIHYFYAIEDSLILDVLLPNYSPDRRITVFRELQDESVPEERRVQPGFPTLLEKCGFCFDDTLFLPYSG